MLKKALTPKLSLLFVSVLLLQNSVAEDYTQWELPEGAKALLGKGVMWEIQYSFSGQRSTRGCQFHRYLALRYGDRSRGRPAYRAHK